MRTQYWQSCSLGLLLLISAATPCCADWPEFRGPTGQGIAEEANLPLKIDVSKPVWKTRITGSGWSSPVIADGRIFLTSAVPGDSDGQALYAVAVDAKSGKLVFETKLFNHPKARIHSKNSHASPTPIVRGNRVYVHFGPHGTAALDLAGEVIWKNDTLKYPPVHGNGGSPILVDNRLVFSCDGSKKPFIVALDADTGAVVWKTPRPSEAPKKFSFSTPLAVEAAGRTQIISPGSDRVSALDSETGEEVWFASYKGYSVIPRPVHGNGSVYFSTSYDRPNVVAIKLGGSGDVTESHVTWTESKGAPHTPSMILHDNSLYMVSDRGVASCVDAATGETHWRERLGGNYSASPIRSGDRLYFISEAGVCTVVKCSKTFEVLATSELGERTLASPAVDGNALIVRTAENLYRFQ